MVGTLCLLRTLFLANVLTAAAAAASSRPGHCRPVSKSTTAGLSSSPTTSTSTSATSDSVGSSYTSIATSESSTSSTTSDSTSVSESSTLTTSSTDSSTSSSDSTTAVDSSSTTTESVSISSDTTTTTDEASSTTESSTTTSDTTSSSTDSSTTIDSTTTSDATSSTTDSTTTSDATSSTTDSTTASDATSSTTDSTTTSDTSESTTDSTVTPTSTDSTLTSDTTTTTSGDSTTSNSATITSDVTSTITSSATCLSGTATTCQGNICDHDEECCGGAYCFQFATGAGTCLQTKFPCTSSTTSSSESTSVTTTASTTESLNILPTERPAEVYNPPQIESYDDCLVDPEDAAFYFTLIDPEDGIPIINVNGRAQKTTEILDVVPEFQFVRAPGTPQGIYDLKLDGQFLAVTLDGEVIFTDVSSGQTYITENGITFITSLFSYDCEGNLLLGLPGIVPFEFGFVDGQLYAQPIIDQYNPPEPGARRRGLDFATRQFIARARYRAALQRTPFVPKPHPTYRRDTSNGQFSDQRCPNYPYGLLPFDRPDARPIATNGCGSTGISRLVPNLNFGSCCDRHDVCFDTCSEGFESCNNNFGSCNRDACTAKHGPGLFRWGCYGLADFYKWAVTGDSGKKAFTSSTSDRCACDCPFGQAVCGGRCIDVQSDPDNCGSCGTSCSSRQCINGQCYVEPSVPEASQDPCAEANYYWFSVNFDPLDWAWMDGGWRNDFETKADCCQQCQITSDCLAYQWLNLPFVGTGCLLYRQRYEMEGNHFSPPKAVCPLGGARSRIGEFGDGMGTGTDEFSSEPGPCANNF